MVAAGRERGRGGGAHGRRRGEPGMQRRFQHGRLESPAGAPPEGERIVQLAELPGARIEQILSGSLPAPLSFVQGHDEWVVLLEGRARLRVAELELELGPGEWLLLPAGCPHTVLWTQAGTSWLAVHLEGDA
jgi:cupin 2 domain-containing protein